MPASQRLRAFARRLRAEPTEAEKRVWARLRRLRASHGLHFRRKHPVRPFVVDFACLTSTLLIEIDGGRHADRAADARRDRFLAGRGYRVLRFWNHEALGAIDACIETIVAAAVSRRPQS